MKDNHDPANGLETQEFDWEDVRRRIAAAEATLAGLDEADPEVLGRVWAQRAATLARVPIEEDQDEQIELVLVQLGRELYGLDAQYVADIKPLEQITHVPRVPDWVAGVVNLRGRIYSVVDLRRFFGLADAERNGEGRGDEKGFLVVAETPAMEVALLVDDVLNVEALPADQIGEASGTVRGLRPEYVQGVTERGGSATSDSSEATDGADVMLVVLNLPALLADERLIIHEEIV